MIFEMERSKNAPENETDREKKREGVQKNSREHQRMCACVRENWVLVVRIFDATLNSSCRFKHSQAKSMFGQNDRSVRVFKMCHTQAKIKPSKSSYVHFPMYILPQLIALIFNGINDFQEGTKKKPWQLYNMSTKTPMF